MTTPGLTLTKAQEDAVQHLVALPQAGVVSIVADLSAYPAGHTGTGTVRIRGGGRAKATRCPTCLTTHHQDIQVALLWRGNRFVSAEVTGVVGGVYSRRTIKSLTRLWAHLAKVVAQWRAEGNV